MTSFKEFKNITALVLLITLVGCSRNSALSQKSTATFVSQPVSGTNFQFSKTDAALDVPSSLTFTVKSCLEDIALLEPVINQSFEVTGGKEPHDVTSDAQGCIYWPESLDFNYLSQESMVEFSRLIKAQGLHHGTVAVNFAVDPWSGDSAAVVDLGSDSIQGVASHSESLKSFGSIGKVFAQEVSLVVQSPVYAADGSTSLNAQLKMSTYITRKMLDLNDKKEELLSGSFHLDLFLIEKPKQTDVPNAVIAEWHKDVEAADGVISENIPLSLKRNITAQSDYELAFRLAPLGGSTRVLPQEAKIEAPSLNSLSENSIPIEGGLDAYLAQFAGKTPLVATSGSSFNVLPLGAVSFQYSQQDPSLNLPRTLSFTVKACLQDISLLQSIVGQSFEVSGGKTSLSLVTDQNGCLYWPEAVDFDFLSPEGVVRLQRNISAVSGGYHRGSVTVTFAVNPWKASEIVDSRVNSLSGVNGWKEGDQPKGSPGQVFAQSVSISTFNPQYSTSGSQINAQIQFDVSTRRKLLDGGIETTPLQSGKFYLELYLVEKPRVGDSTQGILISKKILDASAKDGVINVGVPMPLRKLPGSQSTFELAFKLIAKDSIIRTTPQEAKIEFTKFVGTIGGQTSIPLSSGISGYLAQLDHGLSNGTSDSSTALLQVESINVNSQAVVAKNSEGFPKTLRVAIVECFADKVQLNNVVGQELLVAASTSSAGPYTFVSKTTDVEGCVRWEEDLSLDYFATSHYIPYYLVVKSDHAPFKGFQNTFKMSINPWQPGTLGTWDIRNGAPPSMSGSGRSPSSVESGTRIEITNLSYNYMGRDFSIDRFLNLKVERHYQIRFSPVLFRDVDFSAGVSSQPILTGKFLLKALVMTGVQQDRSLQPLTDSKTTVESVNGMIVADITLPVDFSELPLLALRNQLIIELSDPESQALQGARVSIPFIGISDSTFGAEESSTDVQVEADKLTNPTQSIAALATRGKSSAFHSGGPTISPKDLFETLSQIKAPNASEMAQLGLTDAEMDRLAHLSSLGGSDLSRFCSLALPGTLPLAMGACKIFPSRYLDATRVAHVDRINPRPTHESGDSFLMNMTALVSSSAGSSTDSYQEVEGSVGMSAKFGALLFGNGVDVTSGIRASKGWSYTTSRSRNSTDSMSESKNFMVERVSLDLSVRELECWVVAPKGESVVESGGSKAVHGYHICGRTSEQKTRTESWYYINQQELTTNPALRDPFNGDDLGWIKVVRGDKSFTRLRTLMEDSSRVIEIHKDNFFLDSAKNLNPVLSGFSQIVPAFGDDNIPGTFLE